MNPDHRDEENRLAEEEPWGTQRGDAVTARYVDPVIDMGYLSLPPIDVHLPEEDV